MRKLGGTLITAALVAAVIALAAPAIGSTTAAHNGRIVFQANAGSFPQLFTIKPDGTGLKQITHLTFSANSPGAEQPDWSPDGSTIAFDAVLNPTPTSMVAIYTVAADGSSLTKLPLKVGAFNGAPAFSSDGTMISFDQDVGPSQPTVHGIFVANADGSSAHRVTTGIATNDAYDTASNWSPDGKWLAFTRVKNSTAAAIFIVHLDGSGLKRLTPWTIDAANPKWSPDGTKILFDTYYDSQPGKSANLFTIRPNGKAMTALTHFKGGVTQAYADSWSPDGQQIVWHKTSGPVNQLFLTDAHGRHIHQLTHMPPGTKPGHAAWGTAN